MALSVYWDNMFVLFGLCLEVHKMVENVYSFL